MNPETLVTSAGHRFGAAPWLAIILPMAIKYVFWFVNTENIRLPLLFLSFTLINLFFRWMWIIWRGAKTSCYLFECLGTCAPTCLLLNLGKTRNPVRRIIE